MDDTVMNSLNAYSKSRLLEDIQKINDSNVLSALLVILADYKGYAGTEQEERAFFISEIVNMLTTFPTSDLRSLYQDMTEMGDEARFEDEIELNDESEFGDVFGLGSEFKFEDESDT